MKHTAVRIAAALDLAATTLTPALAQTSSDGQWLVRARAVHLDPANKDNIDGLDVGINSRWIPEVDITYFFTPNIAAELILTYPQKQDVKADGSKIGTLKHLPPVLTVQYHFDQVNGFKPYVGAGLNYTRFSSVDLPAGLSIDKNSFGFALQAGVDYEISKGMYLNLDVKKVQIRTDLKSGGSTLGKVKVDPLLVGLGIGWRF